MSYSEKEKKRYNKELYDIIKQCELSVSYVELQS